MISEFFFDRPACYAGKREVKCSQSRFPRRKINAKIYIADELYEAVEKANPGDGKQEQYDIYQNLNFHPKLILEYLRCGTRDQGSAGEDVPCHEQTFEEPGQRRIPDDHQYKLFTSEVLQYNIVPDIVCMTHDA